MTEANTWRPKVSVIIPVLNESEGIEACLASVARQDYPSELIEIIVADGGSEDRTREMVRAAGVLDARIRVVDNPGRNQAAGLNRGIQASTGDVIARLDGHAAWRPWHVSRCVEIMTRTGADNVGGTMETVGISPLGKAVALATRTRLGAGGAEYRIGHHEREVDTVYLGFFRREVFDRVGLFNEQLPPHEDYELNRRLRQAGGRIVFSPEIPTTYAPRETWTSLARQYFRYGRGKVRAARVTPGVIRTRHLLPPMLLLAIGAGIPGLAARRSRGLVVGLAAGYVALCAGQAIRSSAGIPPSARWRLAFVFPVLHLSWGAGFWVGLLGLRRRQPPLPTRR